MLEDQDYQVFLPDHVELQYSRYLRDRADYWRKQECQLRRYHMISGIKEKACRDSDDMERLAKIENRHRRLDSAIAMLNDDIPWTRRKDIIQHEMQDPCSAAKYLTSVARASSRSQGRDEICKEESSGLSPKTIVVGGIILFFVILCIL